MGIDYNKAKEVFKQTISYLSSLDVNSEEYIDKGGEFIGKNYKQIFSGSETSLESVASSTSLGNSLSSSSSEADTSEGSQELLRILTNGAGIDLTNAATNQQSCTAQIVELKSQLKNKIEEKTFAAFEAEGTKHSPGYPIFSGVVSNLNFHAFSALTDNDYSPFTPSNLRKELLKTDEDGRNIYHWFASALQRKSSGNENFNYNDLALLEALNSLFEKDKQEDLLEKRREFLATDPKPSELLFEIHEVRELAFSREIEKGLSYVN